MVSDEEQKKWLKIQGYKPASPMAEIIFKCMLHKEEEGELRAVRTYKPKKIDEILAREVQLLAAERTITLTFFSLILGDPNNPKERRLFIMRKTEQTNTWDIWERQETEPNIFFNPELPIAHYCFNEFLFKDLELVKTQRRAIML